MIEDIEKQINHAQELIRIAKEMDGKRQKDLMNMAVGIVRDLKADEAEEEDE